MPFIRLSSRKPALLGAITVTVAVALLAACGGATPVSDDAGPPGGEPTVAVDWASRTVTHSGTDAEIAFCEGDGPFLCLTRDGEHLGVIELGHTPVATHHVVTAALAGGRSEFGALEAMAADFLATFEEDRPRGCGTGYEVVGHDTSPVDVAGLQGARYGFRGIVDGRVVEEVVNHAVISGGQIWFISGAGYDDEAGCLAREGHFDIDGIASVEPLLSRIVAGSRLPSGPFGP